MNHTIDANLGPFPDMRLVEDRDTGSKKGFVFDGTAIESSVWTNKNVITDLYRLFRRCSHNGILSDD
jgi:hypothetical protein